MRTAIGALARDRPEKLDSDYLARYVALADSATIKLDVCNGIVKATELSVVEGGRQ